MTWAGNDGVLQPGDTWRCINVSLPSDDGYNRRWQLQPRKSEGHAILVVDVNRFQPLVLLINRGSTTQRTLLLPVITKFYLYSDVNLAIDLALVSSSSSHHLSKYYTSSLNF